MFKKKWVAWVLIAVVGLLPLPAAIKYLQTYIVRNAVVTAFCFQIRSPIDGVVKEVTAAPGKSPGTAPVITIENSRQPRTQIATLEAGCGEKQRYIKVLEEEVSMLVRLLDENRKRRADYFSMIQKELSQKLGILDARKAGEQARLKEAEQARNRVLTLVATSVAAQEDADQKEADYHEALAKVNATRMEMGELRYQMTMLEKQLFPPDLSDGILQVQNLINRLELDISQGKRELAARKTELSIDAARLKALRADFNHRMARAEVSLPKTALVLAVAAEKGQELIKGDPLLSYIDRSRLMVEVAVDDATLELIRPGHPVRIRLFGSNRFIPGAVIQKLGSGSKRPPDRFAAGVKIKGDRDGLVLVSIKDEHLYKNTAGFCGIGRTAYAEFEDIGLMELFFGTFLR